MKNSTYRRWSVTVSTLKKSQARTPEAWERKNWSGAGDEGGQDVAGVTVLEQQVRRVLADDTIPVPAWVRMACSLGTVIRAVAMAGDAFAAVPSDELADILRAATPECPSGTVLAPRTPNPHRRRGTSRPAGPAP